MQLWFFALSVDDLEQHLLTSVPLFPKKHRQQVTAAPTPEKNPLRLESIDKTRARQRMPEAASNVRKWLKELGRIPFKRDRVLLSVYPYHPVGTLGKNTAAIEPLEKLLLAQIPI